MAVDYTTLKKSGFMRQIQKHRFSLRLKVTGGTLTVKQIRTIADVADQYGEGYIHVTSRQGIEIPFIKLEDIDEVKKALSEGECELGASGARVRTITACQGKAVCPSGNIDSYKIALELDSRYFGRNLPHKFKFGVTGCQNNCLKAEENDLGIKGAMDVHWDKDTCILCKACEKVCRYQAIKIDENQFTMNPDLCKHCGRCEKACPTKAMNGEPAYVVSFGGLFGNTIHKGDSILPLIKSEEQLFQITDAALQFFEEHALPGERFKFTIDRIGIDKLKEVVENVHKN